jgi:hypothetical protein
VLEFEVEDAVFSVDYTPEFYLIFPGEGSDFWIARSSRAMTGTGCNQYNGVDNLLLLCYVSSTFEIRRRSILNLWWKL